MKTVIRKRSNLEALFHLREDLFDAALVHLARNCPASNDTPAKAIGWWLSVSNKDAALYKAIRYAQIEDITGGTEEMSVDRGVWARDAGTHFVVMHWRQGNGTSRE